MSCWLAGCRPMVRVGSLDGAWSHAWRWGRCLKHSYFVADAPIRGSGFDWAFRARATPRGETVPVPRGKVVGGCSAINAQIFIRGLPDDFAEWVAQGNDGWAFDDLLPCFRRTETDTDFGGPLHGQDGPIRVGRFPELDWLPEQQGFVTACRDAGFAFVADHNDPTLSGVGPVPFNYVDGTRQSTAVTYLHAARHRRNLDVLPDRLARRVVLDGNRAVGVEIERGGGAPELIESMRRIGVVEKRPDGRINMPDIFRVAARNLKMGGVPPRR